MKWILTTLILSLLNFASISKGETNDYSNFKNEIRRLGNKEKGKLIAAMFWQESSFRAKVKSKSGDDWGILGITSGMVEHLNKHYGFNRFTHYDALDISESLQMFADFQMLHNPELIKSAYPSKKVIEKAARSWNGGYGYWQKDTSRKLTANYWDKIQAKMKILNGNYEVFVFKPGVKKNLAH